MAKITALLNGTKKGQIVKSAAVIFRQKGFRAASVRELAESLGIEAPSLYNHIGSKAELLQEICFGVAKDFTEHMNAVMATKDSAAEKTAALIRFHIRKMYTDFDRVYVSDNEWKQLPKQPAEEFLSQRRAYENSLTGIIEEGIRKKQFRKMNARITMLTILSAVRGPEFRQRHKNDFNVEEVEENMITHLLNGITR